MNTENQFPWEIEDVEPGLTKELLEYFTGKLLETKEFLLRTQMRPWSRYSYFNLRNSFYRVGNCTALLCYLFCKDFI